MNSLFRLDGRIALVTGASSGLGAHFATILADAGAVVALGARRHDRLLNVAENIKMRGGRTGVFEMDVSIPESVDSSLNQIESELGTVDLLVNNAGVAIGQNALDVTEADWDAVINTNLKGAWTVAQQTAKRLVAAERSGVIINIASILAYRVAKGVSPYAASKAALVQLTKSLALEWAKHQIRVNAIAPGYFLTEMNNDFFTTKSESRDALIKNIPQRRIGKPEELSGTLLLLASDASSYMTGSTIVVDGGHMQASI
ncbi:MAG: 2-deoxy-D-gluconate 3-dehydrogenase [Acidiferrobacteraceae bacterium]|nr:2-deoxy-D-gluconate 3-dehydrogenase [Acidiferrobacteraceae bacterium]